MPEPKKRPTTTKKKTATRTASTKKAAPVKKTAKAQATARSSSKKPAPTQKRAPKKVPTKAPIESKDNSNTDDDESEKKGGFFKKIIFLMILAVLVGAGYYAYDFYQNLEKNGFNTEKALAATIESAKSDYGKTKEMGEKYGKIAKDKTIEYSKIAKDTIVDYSDAAIEASKEYKDTIANFSSEKLKELESKIGEIKSSDEMMSMADGYFSELKDDLIGDETPDEYDGGVLSEDDWKVKVESKKAPAEEKPSAKPIQAKKQKEEVIQPNPNKPKVTKNKNEDKQPQEIINPNTGRKVKVLGKNDAPPPRKKEEPKPSSSSGMKIKSSNSGSIKEPQKNSKPSARVRATPTKKTTSKNSPAHMKTYNEGKKHFIEAIGHFKKASPSASGSESKRRGHNKKAHYLFKKASQKFNKIANKMDGDSQFEKMSMDTIRFLHATGKSMLISDH